MSKIETIHKESKRAKKAATCRNSLRWGYSAKDAIEDLDQAIGPQKPLGTGRNPRRGRASWHISRKW